MCLKIARARCAESPASAACGTEQPPVLPTISATETISGRTLCHKFCRASQPLPGSRTFFLGKGRAAEKRSPRRIRETPPQDVSRASSFAKQTFMERQQDTGQQPQPQPQPRGLRSQFIRSRSPPGGQRERGGSGALRKGQLALWQQSQHRPRCLPWGSGH